MAGEKNSIISIKRSCRSLISKRGSTKTLMSYFPNIGITTRNSRVLNEAFPIPKVRIKIPISLLKTVKKKENVKKKGFNARILFPNKVTSLFSNAFGGKNSDITSVSDPNGSPHYSSSDDSSRFTGKKTGLEDWESLRSTSMSSTNSLNRSEENLEIKKGSKKPLKAPLSFMGFLNKKTSLKFIKGRRRNPSIEEEVGCKASRTSKRFWINFKARKENCSRKKVSRRGENTDEKEEDDNKELCKKRILMGERCRPLNFSGSLHYDENGDPITELPAKVVDGQVLM